MKKYGNDIIDAILFLIAALCLSLLIILAMLAQ